MREDLVGQAQSPDIIWRPNPKHSTHPVSINISTTMSFFIFSSCQVPHEPDKVKLADAAASLSGLTLSRCQRLETETEVCISNM